MQPPTAPPERLPTTATTTTRAVHLTPTLALTSARVTWGVVGALCLALFALSLPTRLAELGRLIPAARALHRGDIVAPRATLIAGSATLMIGGACVYFALAGLLFWRRHDETRVILMSLFLLAFGAALPGAAYAIMSATPIWRVTPALLEAIGWAALLLFALLFPTGAWSPRWARWVAPWWLAWVAVFFIVAEPVFSRRPQLIIVSYAIWVAWFGVGVCAQIYRYLWDATPLQRQQSKWVALGFVCALVGILAASAQQIVALSQGHVGQSDLRFTLVALVVVICASLPIPITIAIAILRHNLFDIDRLIKFTLVYSTLTVILGGAYALAVGAMQLLLHAISGANDSSSFALVISTLGAAALFQPLRRRIQTEIDRQFYRRRYDAARIAATFAESLRTELDLSELAQRLVDVAYHTMRPKHVSLWLASSERASHDQVDAPQTLSDVRHAISASRAQDAREASLDADSAP